MADVPDLVEDSSSSDDEEIPEADENMAAAVAAVLPRAILARLDDDADSDLDVSTAEEQSDEEEEEEGRRRAILTGQANQPAQPGGPIVPPAKAGTSGSGAARPASSGGNSVGPHQFNLSLPLPRRSRQIPFDTRLAAEHSYLGPDMEELGGGRTMYESNKVLENVCLFTVPHLILMPGQNLPLQSLHPRAITMFRNIVANQRVFGVVSMRYRSMDGNELANVGTLAQVLQFKEETEHETTVVKVRAVGRQRFELLETRRQLDGTLCAKVKIMPEVILTNSLNGHRLPSLARWNLKPVGNKAGGGSAVGLLNPGFGYRRINHFVTPKLTPLPAFVHDQYNLDKIVGRVKKELAEWYDSSRIDALAQNPIEFSYWVASNLPIDDNMKIQILGMNCALQRLRGELSILTMCTSLCCRECGEIIGQKQDVFSMSVEGPLGAYVNEHGFIHETLTLRKATGIAMIGRQTTENSWFPGYAWRILQCRQCHSHMGWRFKAVEKHLQPKLFWGVTRAAVIPTLTTSGEDEAGGAGGKLEGGTLLEGIEI